MLEADFIALLDLMPDGILVSDADGRIEIANVRAAELFDYAPAELAGRPIESLMPARFREAHVGQRTDFVANRRIRPLGSGLDMRGVRKDGREFPLEISLSTFESADGRTRVVSALRDTSVKVQAREGLARSNRDLALANEDLDAFAYSIAHDLRAPLRAIGGFSSALAESLASCLDQASQHYLDRIRANTIHMNAMIDGVLKFSRSTSKHVEFSDCCLDSLVQEVVDVCQPQYPSTKIAVGTLGTVSGDRAMLREIFQNLVDNALKYSSKAVAPLVEIFREGARPGRPVCVRDNGCGFDMADAGQLFTLFHRMDNGGAFEGSGVGLSIVKRLLERHGGRVEASSAPGAGSTFRAFLPALTAPPAVL